MKKKSLLLLIPFAAAAAVALGSCGNEPAPQCDQASVLLDSQAITIEINESKQLTASSNIEGCEISVNWRSDDASIASVDQNGVVTGHKNGSTTVYANDVPCLVTVGTGHADVAVTGITVDVPASSKIEMLIGDTSDISVTIEPENATNKLLDVTSDNEEVVLINDNGDIEAVGEGTAHVTIASQSNPEVTATIEVTVKDPEVKFPTKTSDDATLVDVGPVLDGATVNFVAKLNDKFYAMDSACTDSKYFKHIESSVEGDVLTLGEGTGSFFVIKNRDGSYSFQTASGKYLAAKNSGNNLIEVDSITPASSFNIEIVDGEATITCIDPTNTDHNTLFLNSNKGSERFACYKPGSKYPKPHIYAKAPVPVPATGVLLDETELTMIIDDEKTLVAEVLPSYAIDKTVTWSTEDKGVVSVENGKVKALAAGEEVVTVTTVNGKTATCTVHVYSEITHVDHVTLNNETLALDIDDISNSLTATVFPENATFKGVSWSTSDKSIVEVNEETGELTAVGVGSATITVTTEDEAKTATCVVTVNAASDGIIHAYEAAMAMEPGTGVSERSYVITGKVTFMPGNNLIVQDGDHSIIVYKSGSSGDKFSVGDTVTMRCQVQNYDGAAETASIKNDEIKVIEKDITVNKGEIASHEAMENGEFSNLVDFKNLVVKSKSEIKEGSDCSMKVTFEDDPTEYTLFVKKSLYNADVAAKLNRIPVGGKFEVSNAYIGNYKGARQVCTGLESVVIDHTEYLPEEVVVKNGEDDVTSLNMVVDDEITLTASVLPVEASQEIVWSTEDNDGVVSVNDGVVKALKAGTATVVVSSKDGSKSKSISVNVTDEAVHVTSVALDKETLELNLKDTFQLTATVGPEEATDKSVTWSVLDESDVVSVDKGLVTALKVGTATVQVETNDGHLTATCVVTVTEKFIDVSEQETYVIDKEKLGLTNSTYVNSADGADIAFTNLCYDSSSVQGSKNKTSEMHNAFKFTKEIKYIKFNVALDKPSATMDVYFGNEVEPTGDPVKMGNETVYKFIANNYIVLKDVPEDSTCFKLVYTNGAVNFSSIEIGFVDYNVPLEGIELNKESLPLVVEESFSLEATLNPSDTTHTTLTYSSDHPEIADVGSDGIISAYAPGTATITVATDDPEISATCVVTVVAAKVPVTKVELTDHETEILQGGCTTLTATVSPDNATITDLIWDVEEGKEDIISVDEDGCVTGLKPGTAKVIVKSVDNPDAYDECEVTVEERFIDVSTMDEYVITAESLGLIEDYASDSSEYFAWTQAKADKSGNIQISGSTTPKSELHNLFGFSKDITYIVIDLASGATENATADLRFGDSVLPTENAVKLGKDTAYPLNVEGKIVIMAPEEGLDFFSLAPTKNAIYIKSITVGFGEYVEHVTGVSLNKETTTIEEGANEQLIATVSPDNASDKSVTWTSSDESIATVDTNGNVTAVSAGEATITVKTTDGEFEANCVVTVVEKIIDVENITLDKETLTLEEGKDSTLVATVTPDDATHPEHTWSSSDESVAKVDQDGKVTAVAPGEATITVKVDGDESKYAECVVTVTEVERQTLPYNGSFAFKDGSEVFPEGNWNGTGVAYYGTAYSFKAKDQYVQATKLFDETSAITVDITALVNSESDTSGVLTVYALNDAGEVVTSDEVSPANVKVGSIDAGKAAALNNIISVTLEGEKITGLKIAYTNGSSNMFLFDVKITDIGKVTDVELSEHDLELVVGNTGTLTATVIPDTAINKEVTFTSDNEDAVTIDASTGAYEAVGVGNATITVTTTDGSYKDTCSVAVSAAERTMTGIIVEGPIKVEYTEGEKLDLSGLVVKAVYDSGDPKVISEGYTTNIALDHPLELTDTSLVVSYNDFDADAITLTINKAPAIVASGNYVIKHTRSDVTYYMSSEVGAKGQPLATTDKSKAAEFDFELKEGTNDTYTIKIHGETKYLALNANDNNGVRYTSSPFEWKIEDGTLASGAYNLSGVYSSTQRFLTFYQNGTDYDFRCYTTADATNRKENSDLEAIVVKDVASIAIKENPTKMTYYVGDPFDPTGMVVTVTYSDDSTVDITEGFTFEGSTGFTAVNPDRTVKVTYKGKNAYVEHVAVIEDERTLTGIEFAEGSDMTKKEYKEGGTWDSTGITVNNVYSDGSREVAEGVSLSFNPASPAVGTTQVVVTATKEGCDPVSMTVTGISVAELPKNVDEITAAAFGVTSSSYASFTDKVLVSGAKYSGMVAKNSNGVIQLNSGEKGIYSTDSLRTLKSISLEFNSNTIDARTVSIYAKQGNFTSTQDTEGATLVATFKKTSTETSFSYSFEDLSNYTNILIRANNAVYLDELVVTWSETKYDAFVFGVSLDETEATVNMGETLTLNATVNGYGENYDQLTWESSDTSKVTVVDGVLTPVAVTEEPVTITATSVADSTKSATCAVTVASARSFTELTTTGGFKTSYKTSDTAFAINDLKVYANYSDGSDEEVTDYTVTWSNAFNTSAGNYTSVPTIHWDGHELVLSEVSYTVSAPVAKASDLVFPSGETVPTGWSTSYAAHTVENDDFAVAFADASYNAPSTGTAWDSKHPTSKTGALTVSLKIDAKITGFSLECLQWGTNAKTISYQYTINGTDWVAGTVTSSNFSLKVDSLPDGVVGLKFATTNTSKQIGFVSLSLNLLA